MKKYLYHKHSLQARDSMSVRKTKELFYRLERRSPFSCKSSSIDPFYGHL